MESVPIFQKVVNILKKRNILLVLAAAAAVALFFFVRAVFRGDIIVNPVIIENLGPFSIRWYGVFIAAAIITAYLIARAQTLREGVKEEYLIEGTFVGIIFGVIGARLYYVAFNFEFYRDDFFSIFKTWDGGLAIHGGFLVGLLVAFLYTTFRKKAGATFLQATDVLTLVFPLGQAIGRWGNFMNYEAYGNPTDLPWKMFVPPQYRMPGYSRSSYFHPTFLYESLANIAIFVFLFWYLRKKRKNYGEVTGLYMILYSIIRFIIEGLRLDSLYIGQTELRTARVVSVILLVVGTALVILSRNKGKPVKEGA